MLARRVVARSERNFKEGKSATGASGPYHAERSHLSLTKKFRQVDEDGDVTLPTSALEAAIDQHCIYFLSSTEAQRCVSALWSGREYGV